MEEKIKKSNSENCKNKNAFLDFANFSCVKNSKDFEIVSKMGAKILIDQEHFLDFSKFPVTQNFQKCCLSINHFVTSARVKQQTNFADAFTWTQNGQKKSTWCFLHFFPEITRHLTEVGPLMIFYHRQVTINLSLGYCGLICRSIQIDWKAGNRNTKIGNAWNIEENKWIFVFVKGNVSTATTIFFYSISRHFLTK